MKTTLAAMGALIAISAPIFLLSSPTVAQNTGQVDGPGLKKLLEGLGHVVKDLNAEPGKEKYEFKVTTATFDVPIGAEISPSKQFVWLTVYLGKAKLSASGSAQNFRDLLFENSKIQPVFFYITSNDHMMLGTALDNNSISPAQLRARIEKLSADVGKSSASWKQAIVASGG